MANRMWGGVFGFGPDEILEEINASIDFDRKLYAEDIEGSKAHAAMLARQGIISKQDARKIAHGLDTILSEIKRGKFKFSRALEDIHTHVEARLKELIGPAAGRLHTARSRNDQVATDFKLFVRKAIDAADTQSAKPAYSGLIYPVIDLDGLGTHKGSHDNLLGPNPPADAITRYNTDKRVVADTPRLFIAHAFDDRTVGIDQSLGMIAAARAAKVPVEAHLFQSGGHGFGARHAPEGTSRRQWPELFERWISKP